MQVTSARKIRVNTRGAGSVSNACTDVLTPGRTRNVPSSERLNVMIDSSTVQLLNVPRFSVTAVEWMRAVLVSRQQDIEVFDQLFDALFRNPELAQQLLAQMLPSAEGQAAPPRQRPRVREALAPFAARPPGQPTPPGKDIDFDAAMTASDLARLKHADFNQLGASEYALVERLVRELRLPVGHRNGIERAARGDERGDQPRSNRCAVGDGACADEVRRPQLQHVAGCRDERLGDLRPFELAAETLVRAEQRRLHVVGGADPGSRLDSVEPGDARPVSGRALCHPRMPAGCAQGCR